MEQLTRTAHIGESRQGVAVDACAGLKADYLQNVKW